MRNLTDYEKNKLESLQDFEKERYFEDKNFLDKKPVEFTILNFPNSEDKFSHAKIFDGQTKSSSDIYNITFRRIHGSVQKPFNFKLSEIKEHQSETCIICKYIMQPPFKYYIYKESSKILYTFGDSLCIKCMSSIYDGATFESENKSTLKFRRYSVKENRKNVSSRRNTSKRKSSRRKSPKRQTSKRKSPKRRISKRKK